MFAVNQSTKQFAKVTVIAQSSRYINIEVIGDNIPTRYRTSDRLEVGKDYDDRSCWQLTDRSADALQYDLDEQKTRVARRREAQAQAKIEKEERANRIRSRAAELIEMFDPFVEQVPGIFTTKFHGFTDIWNPEPTTSFVMIHADRRNRDYDEDYEPVDEPISEWLIRVTWTEEGRGSVLTPSSSGTYVSETVEEATALFFAARQD